METEGLNNRKEKNYFSIADVFYVSGYVARHDNFGEAIDYWSVKGCVQPSLTLQRKVWIFFWWVGGGGGFTQATL